MWSFIYAKTYVFITSLRKFSPKWKADSGGVWCKDLPNSLLVPVSGSKKRASVYMVFVLINMM